MLCQGNNNSLKLHKTKFAIIGGGKLACIFVRMLKSKFFIDPIVLTWKNSFHERDRELLKNSNYYEDIFELCNKEKIKLIEIENPNNSSIISELKKQNIDIIFSICSRWIFSKIFINAFDEKVLNIHLGNLPLDRGGALVSRKILNNDKIAGGTIHIITSKIDQGPILYKKTKKIKKKYPTIDDFSKLGIEIAEELFMRLIDDLLDAKPNIFQGKIQNETESIYLPQLYTEINGAINWDWSAIEIERFIRAFGPPYPGAFTFYNRKKIVILKSSLENTEYTFHPFYFGRIIAKTHAGFVKIATKDKILVVEKILVDRKIVKPSTKLSLSKILHTPKTILDKSKISSVSYVNMKPPKN